MSLSGPMDSGAQQIFIIKFIIIALYVFCYNLQ